MANLTHDGTSLTDTKSWEGTATQTAQEKTYHFSTGGTFVDEDIDFKVTAQAGSAATPTSSAAATSTSLNGSTITVARSVTPTVSEGWVSAGTAGTVTTTATVPTETKTITANGTYTPTDGKLINEITVTVEDTLQDKTVTLSETAQTITADDGYDGLSSVAIPGISSTYIGSGIPNTNGNNSGTGMVATNPYITFTSLDSNGFSSTTGGVNIRCSVAQKSYLNSGDLLINSTVKDKGKTTYTPTTSDQTISSGIYLSGDQTIAGDANLVAENIAEGISIFGITGTYEGGTDVSDATATAAQILSPQTAYISTGKVTGTMTNYGDSTQDLNAQSIYYDTSEECFRAYIHSSLPAGYYTGLESVTYLPLSALGTATASQVLSGATFTSDAAKGVKVTGTMPSYTSGTTTYSSASVSESNLNVVSGIPSSGYGYYAANAAITTAIPLSNFGTATASEVIKGKTFTSSAGLKVTGTLPDYLDNPTTTFDSTLSGQAYAKAEISGSNLVLTYNCVGDNDASNGGEVVSGVCDNDTGSVIIPLAAFGTATADKVLSGYTFTSSAGVKVAGTATSQNYYTGSSDPSASTGSDGDLYFKI